MKSLASEMNKTFDALIKKAKKKKNIDVDALSQVIVLVGDSYNEW